MLLPASLLGRLMLASFLATTVDARVAPADRAGAREDVDVLHYAVELSPDFETHTITGRTIISFRVLRDGVRDIRLSANALTIDRAVSGRQTLQVSTDRNDLVVALPRPMTRGSSATIAVTYHGVPARGLVFGRRSVYTSYFACDWMFCTQDRPGDKATMHLTLMLPKGMTSLGIGTLHSIAPASPGIEAHVWREERPYSSYVYGFAAGALDVASERQGPLELRYLSEEASPERLRALFASTGRMVRFFEEKAGVPIPHSRYAQVLVSGSAAQEAATFSVVGEEEVSPILEHPEEDWVIAHELAHQWWGNLVTCTDWSEFWLNEGITTFMVAAWKEHAWGRAAYDREMELARRRLDTANKAGIDVPLTYRGAYPSLSLRRAIQYSKGALFMDRLRQELGDEAFWPALRSFTRAHAGKTVESRDLQRAFEVAAKRDLADLFTEWVY